MPLAGFRTALIPVLLLGSLLHAQERAARPWQKLNMPSVAEVRAAWNAPGSEYGPDVYYGLNGPVTLDTVRHDLDTIRRLGFRAVTVQYGYGSDGAYLSPEYLAFFRQFVFEAKRLDLRVWIVDDAGYPSGFAGGKFTSEHPELRMQALVTASRTAVEGGGSFEQEVAPDTVAISAISADGRRTLQIPFGGGRVRWTAPEGQWTVYVVQHAFRTSPTRSDTNPKRVKDGSQSLEDYLDPAATADFLQLTHEAYKRAVGEEFGKTILGFRGDEPDYSISGLPWTGSFFARFESEKGYDIRPYLAAFFQPHEIKLSDDQLRARADYYDVFANMFRDGFFKPQGEWCAANGLEYQVHLNHEEQQVALAHSEGDFFRDMQYVQVPGIDTIWHQIWTDTISDFPRFASSAAHVYGHPRAFTESFAAYRPLPDVAMARYVLNEQFVRGINLVEAMYFPATSSPGGGGPMAFMRDPQFPSLMRYTSRLSFLLSRGRPAADVALLLAAESLWMDDAKADETFVTAERVLSEHQVDFDIVGEDAVGTQMRMDAGRFATASGNAYRTVLVPRAELLPGAVVERLRAFAKGGGHVVFLRATPSFVGSRSDLHAHAAKEGEFDWATTLPFDLPSTPTPPMQPPSSAPEPLAVPNELLSRLEARLPVQDVALSTPRAALRVAHRVLRDGDVFLLFNESGDALQEDVTLRSAGHSVERWDADTGSVEKLKAERDPLHRAMRVRISLEPHEAEVLVVH